MSFYMVTDRQLEKIADALRLKTGTRTQIEFVSGFLAELDKLTETNDANAVASDIVSGKTAYVKGQKITGNIAQKNAGSVTVNVNVVTVPSGFYSQQVQKTIGTAKAAATYNTSTTDQEIASGMFLTGKQTIRKVTTSGISAANIKAGVTIKVGDAGDDDRIIGVTGTFTSDANAAANHILNGKSGYVNGSKISGNIVVKSINDITLSGRTVSVPAGYYGSQMTKTMSDGSVTQGNPTINASGLVTATATVTAGYVTGTTLTKTLQLTTQAGSTISPTESEQTAVAAGKYLTGDVKVGAVSSSYIGSSVSRVSGKTVTPTENVQTAVAANTYTNGAIKVGSISSTYLGSSVPTQAAKTITPTESAQTAVASGTYTTGAVKVSAVSSSYLGSAVQQEYGNNITPTESQQTAAAANRYVTGDIKVQAISSTYIGSGVPYVAAKTVTPTESAQTAVAAGSYTTGDIKVGAISSSYIGSGIGRIGAQTIRPSRAGYTLSSGNYLTGSQTYKAVKIRCRSFQYDDGGGATSSGGEIEVGDEIDPTSFSHLLVTFVDQAGSHIFTWPGGVWDERAAYATWTDL